MTKTKLALPILMLLVAACTKQPAADVVGSARALRCDAARSSTSLPARSELLSGGGASANTPTVMATRDLFDLFKGTCGGCHVDGTQGDFHVTADTFPTVVDNTVLMRIKSDDPSFFMPPPTVGGKPYSTRAPTDPVVQLFGLLETWIDQNRPKDQFTVAGTGVGGASPYLASDWTIDNLTNLGDCIPSATLVGTRQRHMEERDAFFAAATQLPDSLADTDFDTLDGAALAGEGVIGYAPTYPLWTDDAGKLRFIRVPRGQSVEFDDATQSFRIPPNTRFYKTFLRKVIDLRGYTSWRKIETRLIVSRPDRPHADGTFESTALYGTYVWNDDESEARLQTVSLRDGTGLQRSPDQGHRRRAVRQGDRRQQACRSRLRARGGALRHHPPLRHPGQPALRAVPHGARRLRPRLHAAAAQPARRRRRRRLRARRRRRADAAPAAHRLRRHQRHGLARRCHAARGVARQPRAAQRLRAQGAGVHGRQLRALPQPARLPVGGEPRAGARAQLPARAPTAASSSFRSTA